ncbi:hypothetical protein HAX54_045043 [Datura stramonium]|uniref:Uncharacterized protein n=1 Tax=Datura stramonium TaxID=4076 RepID=A0ABS8WHF2_DATST|nr:hypothetical protein [Datura stramonium]
MKIIELAAKVADKEREDIEKDGTTLKDREATGTKRNMEIVLASDGQPIATYPAADTKENNERKMELGAKNEQVKKIKELNQKNSAGSKIHLRAAYGHLQNAGATDGTRATSQTNLQSIG